MTISALILDVDGVLVRAGVFAEILERDHGLDRAVTSDFFQGPFKQCVIGRADLKEALSPYLRGWGWEGSVEDLLRLWFEADSRVNEDVLSLVERVRERGLACYVASTQESHRAAYLEDVLGFRHLFDGLFFSCRAGTSKPDPTFFEHVAGQLGIAPPELLLVDDHDPNVEGARASGWQAELYRWGDDMRALLGRYGIEVPGGL